MPVPEIAIYGGNYRSAIET